MSWRDGLWGETCVTSVFMQLLEPHVSATFSAFFLLYPHIALRLFLFFLMHFNLQWHGRSGNRLSIKSVTWRLTLAFLIMFFREHHLKQTCMRNSCFLYSVLKTPVACLKRTHRLWQKSKDFGTRKGMDNPHYPIWNPNSIHPSSIPAASCARSW